MNDDGNEVTPSEDVALSVVVPAFDAAGAIEGVLHDLAEMLLGSDHEYVRAWTIRLLGDPRRISPGLSRRLVQIAGADPSAVVRSQLACTAKRLPAGDALPIIAALWTRDEDAGDPFIPLLLWWAVEDKAVTDRDAVLELPFH